MSISAQDQEPQLTISRTQGMEQLTRLIFERAQPKRLGAQVITGPMLATLASEYVRAINEGAVPTISTAWQVRRRSWPFCMPSLSRRREISLHAPLLLRRFLMRSYTTLRGGAVRCLPVF